MSLADVLKDDAKKRAVIRDGAALIDREVGDRRGLSAVAVKAGYKAVKAIRPGIIEHALAVLLPEFAPVLDPFYESGRAEGNVDLYFERNADAIANALLRVTDRRADHADNGIMRRVYGALRGTAQREVAASVPRIAPLIRRHLGP